MKVLQLASAALFLAAPVFAADYDESVSGDISDDRLNPTVIALGPGNNRITATQQGDAFGRDIDYFTFTVPAGMRVRALHVVNYTAVIGDLAFLGVQNGPIFTTPFNNTKAGDLLGGKVYGDFDIGFDILPEVGTLSGATGFVPPLPAGDYTWWLNQTGDPSTVELNFQVETDLGTNYCTSNINSTGSAATIGAFGSPESADNFFFLTAENVPVGTPGLFFFGPNQVQLPFGDGLRCVGGSIQRIQPAQFGDANGEVVRNVDMTAFSGGLFNAGATVNLQYWYRDPSGGPAGFNLSDGLTISWL